jgi:hypothetical protein
MNTLYLESLKEREEIDFYAEIKSLVKQHPWAWQTVCGVTGLAGGVVAPVLGATSGVMTSFVNSRAAASYLNLLSIVFCALTMPLLILGAFCLNSLEAKTAPLSTPSEPPHDEATSATTASHVTRQDARTV